jgi:hypothetical protein
MSASSAGAVTDLLRTLPDMEPPADAWSRLRAAQQPSLLSASRLVWPSVAAAACAAVIAVGLLVSNDASNTPVPLVAASASAADAMGERGVSVAQAADLHGLRRQSRQLELRLAGLPRRSQMVRADVAGMIAELQDQIAAVDYELQRTSSVSASTARWPSAAPAAIYASDRAARYGPDELWGRRVRLMSRLVSIRFAEAGVAAY